MNVFEEEDYKPPWKATSYPDGTWDVVSNREDPKDSYSVAEHTISDEKLCKLWAAAPELLEWAKIVAKAYKIPQLQYLIEKIGV